MSDHEQHRAWKNLNRSFPSHTESLVVDHWSLTGRIACTYQCFRLNVDIARIGGIGISTYVGRARCFRAGVSAFVLHVRVFPSYADLTPHGIHVMDVGRSLCLSSWRKCACDERRRARCLTWIFVS